MAAQVLFGAYLVAMNLNSGLEAWAQYGGGAPKSPLYGIWNIEQMVIDGQTRSPLTTDYDRFRRVIFDRPTQAAFQRMNDTFVPYAAKIDTAARTVTLTRGSASPGSFSYEQPSPDVLVLNGSIDGHKMQMQGETLRSQQFLARHPRVPLGSGVSLQQIIFGAFLSSAAVGARGSGERLGGANGSPNGSNGGNGGTRVPRPTVTSAAPPAAGWSGAVSAPACSAEHSHWPFSVSGSCLRWRSVLRLRCLVSRCLASPLPRPPGSDNIRIESMINNLHAHVGWTADRPVAVLDIYAQQSSHRRLRRTETSARRSSPAPPPTTRVAGLRDHRWRDQHVGAARRVPLRLEADDR